MWVVNIQSLLIRNNVGVLLYITYSVYFILQSNFKATMQSFAWNSMKRCGGGDPSYLRRAFWMFSTVPVCFLRIIRGHCFGG